MRRGFSLVVAAAFVLSACSTPVTVAGDGGPLTLPNRPSKIVSLSATHTEMLYAIGAGDRLVATDLTSNYPTDAQATPKVDAFNFSIEEIAAFEPDLVITAFDFQGEVAALEQIGVPVLLLSPATTLDAAYDQIEVLGEVTGRSEDAEDLVELMRTRIDDLVNSLNSQGLTLFHEVDNTLYSANSSTFLGDIYRRLGLINLADGVPDEFGAGYVQVAEEYLFSEDPDVIFLGDAQFGESIATVAIRPGWHTLSAVRGGAVFELNGDIAGRWGPRTVDLVEDIVSAIASLG